LTAIGDGRTCGTGVAAISRSYGACGRGGRLTAMDGGQPGAGVGAISRSYGACGPAGRLQCEP